MRARPIQGSEGGDQKGARRAGKGRRAHGDGNNRGSAATTTRECATWHLATLAHGQPSAAERADEEGDALEQLDVLGIGRCVEQSPRLRVSARAVVPALPRGAVARAHSGGARLVLCAVGRCRSHLCEQLALRSQPPQHLRRQLPLCRIRERTGGEHTRHIGDAAALGAARVGPARPRLVPPLVVREQLERARVHALLLRRVRREHVGDRLLFVDPCHVDSASQQQPAPRQEHACD